VRINSEANKWEICTTGACTNDDEWESTNIDATGLQGIEGPQGDAIFAPNGVDNSNPSYVEFILADGETKIKVPKYSESPRFLSFGFKASDNLAFASNVACSIEENTIFIVVPHVEVPYLLQKKWAPNFTFEGASVLVGDKVQESGKDSVDFSAPVEYTVKAQSGESTTYTVKVLSNTGLPIVSVNTKDNAPILSKDDYVDGDVRILGDLTAPIFSGTMRIKGRGNATWRNEKKPYRIKLDNKAEVLGMPEDKDWVLLAEYTDKSLLRNTYAFELSKLVGLPWTPRFRHVEFFKNGIYQGTYLLGEHVKDGKNRADIKKDGFLIEEDGYWAQEPLWFKSSLTYYTFKYPDPDDISGTHADYLYIKNLMIEFEAALYSNNFADPEIGYRKYIDVDNFVLWYLVQETLGNVDPNPYFALESRSSKLKKYPVWDSDWSLGLTTEEWPARSPETSSLAYLADRFYWQNRLYYNQLFKDPYFVNLVKEQWQHMKLEWVPALERKMDEKKEQIRYAQKENFNRWNLLGQYTGLGLVHFATWEEEVAYTKTFLKRRVAWLDTQISSW
jgi:hypothetical protein